MLTIDTKLQHSNIHGTGVFASEIIRKGDVVWMLEDNFLKSFDSETYKQMSTKEQEFLNEYATLEGDTWWLDLDNTRFINHSITPNIEFKDGVEAVALRNIFIGEEITCDYLKLSDYNKRFDFVMKDRN